jgi:signal transduction histidine kinase/ActR/RegA family two-component response regulator
MRKTSLRQQLTRASMLTTLSVLLLCAAALVGYELLTYRRAWVADLRTQADLIAHASAASLVFNDPKTAAENLALLKLQARVESAAIYKADGSSFARYAAARTSRAPAVLDPALRDEGARFEGSVVEIAYPVVHDDELIGTVYIVARHDVWSRVASYAGIVLALIALGALLAYFVFDRLQRRVTQPLLEMSEVAREVMGSRNWKLRAPPTRYEDVGVLVDAFNGMLKECSSRTMELEAEMAERVRAEQGLVQADRRKDEFLATLAHELRNPLAPMTMALALTRGAKTPPEARERAFNILDRQLHQMARLIDDLLDVSRVTSGRLALQREALDLTKVVEGAVELAEPAAMQKEIRLTWRAPVGPALVTGDPMRLAQVFANLLSNACRYTPRGGRIEVTAERTDSAIEIAVTDTGIGIEPAMQARIFDLFEQADKSLGRGNTGLGVGLTLARQLVQLHEGELSVYSAGLGQGSRFTVRLPALSRPALAIIAKPDDDQVRAPETDVLLADDNVDFAISLADVLTARGYEVRVVHDGAAAVDAAVERPPAIALLDIGMPKLNGYQVARELRANPATRGIRLIAITGWGQDNDKKAAADAGFDSHLTKPVEPEKLIKAMRQVADSR